MDNNNWDILVEKAKRFNQGKTDFTLIPISAREEEARVWMLGEEKYGRDNWRKFWGDDTIKVILQSAYRHLAAIEQGEYIDSESGHQHAAHVRCNMAMIIEYLGQKK